MKLLSCLRTALCLLGLLAMPAAAAYPEKPINMIIAFTAGGSSDVQARIMQKYWTEKFHSVSFCFISAKIPHVKGMARKKVSISEAA